MPLPFLRGTQYFNVSGSLAGRNAAALHLFRLFLLIVRFVFYHGLIWATFRFFRKAFATERVTKVLGILRDYFVLWIWIAILTDIIIPMNISSLLHVAAYWFMEHYRAVLCTVVRYRPGYRCCNSLSLSLFFNALTMALRWKMDIRMSKRYTYTYIRASWCTYYYYYLELYVTAFNNRYGTNKGLISTVADPCICWITHWYSIMQRWSHVQAPNASLRLATRLPGSPLSN